MACIQLDPSLIQDAQTVCSPQVENKRGLHFELWSKYGPLLSFWVGVVLKGHHFHVSHVNQILRMV